MGPVTGIDHNDDGKLDKSSSALPPRKQIANPVVYKLVRVEGDGRLVPATDDEVMEVEGFLECDNSEMRVVADNGQSLECISIERSSSGKLRLECSKGTAEADLGKLNSKLQYIEQILQKVKHEEKLRLSCGASQFSADKFHVMDGKIQSDPPDQEIPSVASSLNCTRSNQSGSFDQCSRPSEGAVESGSSAPAVYSKLKRDFSMFEGEICLDKLSIRELHELFKVTFGRETTVKDKQWLKRRIAISLTNSCDVSATTFIVKDNKFVRKCEDSSENGNAEASITLENMPAEEDVNFKDSSAAEDSGFEDNLVVAETRLGNHNMEHKSGSGDHQSEQRAAKRIRKPTKRYIEELSENESRDHHPRLLGSNKNIGIGYTKPARNASSEMRTSITRLDTLGGCCIQIPCVSRVRKSYPRRNMTSLMIFLQTGMGEAEKLANRVLGEHGLHGSNSDNKSPDKVLKLTSTPGKFHQPSAPEPGKEQCAVKCTIEVQQELKPKQTDPSSRTSDDDITTVPTAKGGMRRKHHRAWTLVEVMNLVEGVSQCGAGRWSEIKRLSFSSYSYRTSVDLKDKWRNLLKASYAPADDGMNSRKHGTIPIPESILARVRELAEMNLQVPPNLSSSKLTTGNVLVDRSGLL
ncbi:PREDICTED: uncharacterized protein LOC109334178 isoform X1 [Lupinus angustifolius]|uniref:uncharacterized protein LOC109334178 isoform X1 n=1 Tax=Lupinus angustifolius TaxID=3871 RepID=UPI00092F6DDE|nr:PREDICTED: uncharacterized protein LOC109334178 isoform X1 [Lupinus angustifolius]